MAVVRAILETAVQAGAGREQLLSMAGIAQEQLELSELRVRRSDVLRLCEHALDLSGDPALGLRCAATLTFAPVSHLIVHAPNLKLGLALLARFSPLLADQTSYRVLEHGDKVVIEHLSAPDASPRMRRFSAEFMLGVFFRLVRSFEGQAALDRVRFDYPAPSYRAEYTRLFEGAESFDQPFTGLVFDHRLLEAASPQRDDELCAALTEIAQRRLQRLQQPRLYAARVRDFLVREGIQQGADMTGVAHTLGMSVRSLRRRLFAEGESYHALASEALALVAKRLLREERRPIQEVARELGFANASAFYRAFRRWTGTTPRAWRDGERA